MNVSESGLAGLPLPEQVFTVVNDERLDRGLAPIDYMTNQLNAYAQSGASAATDPTFPSSLTGGAPITFGGSIWAGGLTSVLEADYYWMYDDGWGGSSTSNSACTLANLSGCWGHRDIVLHQFGNCPTGPPVLSMGAAFSPAGYVGGSIAAILVSFVRHAQRHHHDLGPGFRRGPVGLAHGRHRARQQRDRVLGGRSGRNGRRLRFGAELRFGHGPAQLTDRRYGRHA